MTRRHIHYESAFEDFLQSEAVPYVAVNEARKAIFGGGKVKSFDFLVYGANQTTWLVDVKGRQFPYDGLGGRHYWENWVTRDDLEGLRSWQGVFGAPFAAAFVFAYWLDGSRAAWPQVSVHPYRGRDYGFLAVRLSEYQSHCRPRSAKWNTFTVPRAVFRRLARPVQAWWRPEVGGQGVYWKSCRSIMAGDG
jgi:hypothetical protein